MREFVEAVKLTGPTVLRDMNKFLDEAARMHWISEALNVPIGERGEKWVCSYCEHMCMRACKCCNCGAARE